jgi:hypothetical protein
MTDAREVLSALIDREPVDPDVLARVLDEPDGRAMLVDFVRVRLATLADGPEDQAWRPDTSEDGAFPAPGFGLRASGRSHGSAAPGSGLRAPGLTESAPGSRLQAPGRSRGSRWLRVAAVFALLAAGAGGGAWVERYVSRERPPEPDRVVRLDPVAEPKTVQIARNETGGRP